MENILKTATDWAKAELFSTPFFIVFGIGFMLASLGFWQLGKTDLAKAYIFPTLIAGVLLLIIGVGLFYTNKTRITQFEEAYKTNETVFIASEIERTEATLIEYSNVFKIIPIIIVVCALLVFFVNTPIWRAIGITTIAMMIVILLVDGNAHARIDTYHKHLQLEAKNRK